MTVRYLGAAQPRISAAVLPRYTASSGRASGRPGMMGGASMSHTLPGLDAVYVGRDERGYLHTLYGVSWRVHCDPDRRVLADGRDTREGSWSEIRIVPLLDLARLGLACQRCWAIRRAVSKENGRRIDAPVFTP